MKTIDFTKERMHLVGDHTIILDYEKTDYTIVDLGFCEGNFMSEMDFELPRAIKKYVGVDPNPNTNFEELMRRQVFDNLPDRFSLHRAAIYVGEEKSVQYFDITHDKQCNNIVASKDDYFLHNSLPQVHQVPTIKLSEIIEIEKIDKIDILKIDIEGYEYELIESFTPEIASRIDQITIEFHDFVNPNLRNRNMDAIEKLMDLGFEMAYNRPSKGWHGTDYYDTLFVNTLI